MIMMLHEERPLSTAPLPLGQRLGRKITLSKTFQTRIFSSAWLKKTAIKTDMGQK